MEQGTVKWYDVEKGYGFISHGNKDYFVHKSNLVGVAMLDKNQRVEFEIGEGRKGPEATNVRPLDEES